MKANRFLTSHKVSGLNEAIEIGVMDCPGSGGACQHYEINLPEGCPNNGAVILFQRGLPKDGGINGISNEALLAIVEDRLAGFQSGEFANIENAIALAKVQEAIMWLHKRTRDRIARGVEGTLKK